MLYKVKYGNEAKSPLPHLKPLFSTSCFISQQRAVCLAFKMAAEQILGVVLLMISHWECILQEESFCVQNEFLSRGRYRNRQPCQIEKSQ